MKTLFLALFVPIFFTGQSSWLNDMQQAKELAKSKHEFILLNFSGSDWCGPCIKMHDQVFESEVFRTYAQDHLVLVNADFPRNKKNQLSAEQQSKNNKLADKYNAKGIFPYTLLMDSDGNVLKSWEGFFEPGAEPFVNEIKNELLGRGN